MNTGQPMSRQGSPNQKMEDYQASVFHDDAGASNGERKRRRVRTNRFDFDTLDNEEQKLMQQAIRNSQRDKKRTDYEIKRAPEYYPTIEEFRDPLAYIKSISAEASQFGICKIVPPKEWNPPCQIDMDDPSTFSTRLQNIHTLQESVGYDEGKEYSINAYKEMADSFRQKWLADHYEGRGSDEVSFEELAKDYWSIVETQANTVQVEYGNDIGISSYRSGFINKSPFNVQDESIATLTEHNNSAKGEPIITSPTSVRADDAAAENRNLQSEVETPKTPSSAALKVNNSGVEPSDSQDMFSDAYYGRTGWNLINLPSCKGSLLKYLQTPVNGINVPWLYIGMLFTTFCWHNEDNYLYSINYNHFGSSKQWYGVPGSYAKSFEKVAKEFLLELFQESPDLLQHMTTHISPNLLIGNGVPVYQCQQDAKSFIITFPKAFHAGFSYGFNCGEAVNFALDDWLAYGVEAEEKYRLIARPSVFSHQRLLFTLLQNKCDMSQEALKRLMREVVKVIDEELVSRPAIYSLGVRDLSAVVRLPPNKFHAIDYAAAEFDDTRTCRVCTHVCVFSAVACECSNSLVSCIRHAQIHCKCPKSKQTKYLIAWASDDELRIMKSQIVQKISSTSLTP